MEYYSIEPFMFLVQTGDSQNSSVKHVLYVSRNTQFLVMFVPNARIPHLILCHFSADIFTLIYIFAKFQNSSVTHVPYVSSEKTELLYLCQMPKILLPMFHISSDSGTLNLYLCQ